MHILNSVRPDRQLVLFSATFPRSMEALARRILSKPLEITVGGKSVVCDDVSQNVVVLNDEDKFLKLLELLGRFQESGSVIVFTHKHEVADALLNQATWAAEDKIYTLAEGSSAIAKEQRSRLRGFRPSRLK